MLTPFPKNSFVTNGFGDDVYVFGPPSTLFVISNKGEIRHQYNVPTNCSSDGCINSQVPYVLPLSENLTHKILFYSNNYAHNDGLIFIDRLGSFSFKPLLGLTRNYSWSSNPDQPWGWGLDDVGNLTYLKFLDYEWHPTFGVMETVYFDKDMNPTQIVKAPPLPNYRHRISLLNNNLLTCEKDHGTKTKLELYGKNGILESLMLPIGLSCYGTRFTSSVYVNENGFTAQSDEGKNVRLEIKRNGCQYGYLSK